MTNTLSLEPRAKAKQASARRQQRHPIRRLITGLLRTVALLIVIISGLPIVLLYFVTAVPVFLAGILTLIDLGLIAALFYFDQTPRLVISNVIIWIFVSMIAIALSQHFASTPPIMDANGKPIRGSIATMEAVELNGSQQWITIRGNDTNNPILLFLAGGPGGSELVMTRRYLGDLEAHFVVVNWDQPGTGKSYGAVPFDELTPERYVDDAHALALYLRERFDKEKIYVFGESWGSIIGVWLVQQYPDLFYALITTGQMVDPVENDILMYDLAFELLTEQGRNDDVEMLRRNGPPPYTSGELLGKFGAINGVLNNYMDAHAHGEGTHHNLLIDSLGAQEYGLVDKVTWLLGLAKTFTTVYPQIYDVDLRMQAPRLEIPVYMIKGRWDVNAPNSLAEEYFNLLEAPHKEWFWFEDSAHTPSWDEPAHFTDVIVNTVLAQTQPDTQ
ncbi:alpha/beta fold hydrolase [Phototrophicus methaneseepsis]|uniref:prolyl aminopeptidase n=1 Tax=Phototrophicus methaneseepsis TaxID=2710758 RepID=A0A7S8E6P5_9CHLR|nr:alpha/beta hydrolase [Phototrophicus methaneseepsis]QPC81362.1 alpha/beta fold hydrolase [Phototrophicus methaneseepsis]